MRLCPECDARTDDEVCPKCGTRTYLEAESDAGIDPLLGQVLDQRYRIEARIGRGGMGTVYRAVQIAMNRTVAVKVMNPELARNNEAVKRFHREARAATAFEHPHAIRLIDFGQAKTRELFMVMEFLRGRELSKVIREEAPFPVERAAKVGAEIGKALAAAHGVGLMHRDMKPDNVFLLDTAGDHDFVKVLDFGIAKFVSGSGDSTMTRTGQIVGTPQFMAPEQAKPGAALTPAIDVYALGVMLFTMLTGKHPFTGTTPLDALLAHINQPVPELPTALALPNDVRALTRRMLAKEPALRPSADEVVVALERVRLVELARSLHAPASEAAVERASVPRDEGGGLAPTRRLDTPPEPAPREAPPSTPRVDLRAPEPLDVGSGRDSLEFALESRRRRWPWVTAAVVVVLLLGGVLGWRAMHGGGASARPHAANQNSPEGSLSIGAGAGAGAAVPAKAEPAVETATIPGADVTEPVDATTGEAPATDVRDTAIPDADGEGGADTAAASTPQPIMAPEPPPAPSPAPPPVVKPAPKPAVKKPAPKPAVRKPVSKPRAPAEPKKIEPIW